jgi:glycosyltransferase involved in cell wall biosynthesis
MYKILTVIEHYMPSYKGGGPIRSISNTIDALGKEFEYLVLTSDRDLRDSCAFEGIVLGKWNLVGDAKVRYLTPREKRIWSWKSLLNRLEYDLIYLNSFFARLTVMTLFLRWIGLIPRKPVLIAVRGELSKSALALKWFKKKTYLILTKMIGFYDGVKWQASSAYELEELLYVLRIPRSSAFISLAPVYIAPDLPRKAKDFGVGESRPPKQRGSIRIVFLSRIARIKNLDIALELISGIKGLIEFDIFGPLEDQKYWNECQRIIRNLPADIIVNYKGTVYPDDVERIFSLYHLFLFPTRNENFGHVILEAFSAGCLVLTSDATAWRGLEAKRVGWDIPIGNLERYRNALNDAVAMDSQEFQERSRLARHFGHEFANDPLLVQANRKMFLGVLTDVK